MDTPRQYSLVKFNFDNIPDKYHERYPFSRDDRFIFFGEIPNMMGHCVVTDQKTGKLLVVI